MSKVRSRSSWRRLVHSALVCFGVSLGPVASAQTPVATRAQLAEALRVWMDDYAALGDAPDAGEAVEAFRPGVIEQFQIRSEADRLDLGRQRYGVRVQPKLPHVRRAERRLQAAERGVLTELALPARRDADEDALRLLFALGADALELRAIDSLIALQRSLVEVSFRRIAEPNYDVDRVLDAQDDLADLRLRRERLTRRAIARPAPLPLERLVAIGEVAERLEVLRQRGPAALPPSTRLAVIDAELALERAENQRWLDFLQVNYRSDLDEQRQRYSIGGGVELPLRPSALPAVDKLRVERLEEERERAIETRERERVLADDIDAVLLKLDDYRALARSLEERRRNRLPLERILASSPEAQPEDILRLRRRNLSDQLGLLDSAAEVLGDYAELLGEHFIADEETLAEFVLGKN